MFITIIGLAAIGLRAHATDKLRTPTGSSDIQTVLGQPPEAHVFRKIATVQQQEAEERIVLQIFVPKLCLFLV